jgi:uncharacterized protein
MKDYTDENPIIYLRGHHLLCLQGYQGYGYNREFEKNMAKILNELNDSEYNSKIIVTTSPDNLCNSCPNLKDDICIVELDVSNKTKNNLEIGENNKNSNYKNNKNIIKMDCIVLKKANIKQNTKYSFEKLIFKVNKAFKQLKDVEEVCGDCKWIDKCLWYLSRK